ncbi:hypothetical protein IWC96_07155 [Brevundimonas sp. BAL450]|uniref:Lipoprotein n=1 Tax=Brevundimonas abyssalis TAR-001 TaxID=1391729 RepID=A0A8E0TT65_9CAUL|nr:MULTISPECIES: hypothetical protein [Brevundimonas]MBG7615060.1 hypothetical protein [Brevundimonas sp. BAL450]GAD59996.1 hypothetical protein MBEBAB_2246 [Brevundimonas abyssalis TAR-001]
MRLMIVAASAAVLGLAACNQEEDTPAMDETVAAEDVAIDTAATDPEPESAPVMDSTTQDNAVPPADMNTGPGPVTEDARADAQAEAESTNLRPRTE